MEQYRYELHSSRKNDDLIVDRYKQFYDADGNWEGESKPHTLCVHPGMADPDWPWHIRAIANARHPKTIKDRYTATEAYRAAKDAREQAIAVREALIKATKEAFDAKAEAKAAHDVAVASGNQKDIDAALVVHNKAIAAHTSLVSQRNIAVLMATEAETAAQTAQEARDAARLAHEAFVIAEN